VFCITSARPPLQHIIKALSASTELGINAQPEDLPELHPADLMKDAIIITASVWTSFQGGYTDVRMMTMWSDTYCSRLQMLREHGMYIIRGLGRDLDPA